MRGEIGGGEAPQKNLNTAPRPHEADRRPGEWPEIERSKAPRCIYREAPPNRLKNLGPIVGNKEGSSGEFGGFAGDLAGGLAGDDACGGSGMSECDGRDGYAFAAWSAWGAAEDFPLVVENVGRDVIGAMAYAFMRGFTSTTDGHLVEFAWAERKERGVCRSFDRWRLGDVARLAVVNYARDRDPCGVLKSAFWSGRRYGTGLVWNESV